MVSFNAWTKSATGFELGYFSARRSARDQSCTWRLSVSAIAFASVRSSAARPIPDLRGQRREEQQTDDEQPGVAAIKRNGSMVASHDAQITGFASNLWSGSGGQSCRGRRR